MAQEIPENLTLLHSGEETFRQKSISAITSDADSFMHLEMVECVMDYLQFNRMNHRESDSDEDLRTIQLLEARIFNSLAAATKLILSGYYQAAASLVRDVLETSFLLDYFSIDRTLIKQWKEADERKRGREFGPAKIRKALDERDGFKERKREEHYKQLSTLATHPTFRGLTLLRPTPSAEAQMGPFFAANLLSATIQELVKVAVHAGQTCRSFFSPQTLLQCQAALHLVEKEAAWTKRVYSKTINQKLIAALKAMIGELSR